MEGKKQEKVIVKRKKKGEKRLRIEKWNESRKYVKNIKNKTKNRNEKTEIKKIARRLGRKIRKIEKQT